METKNEKGRAVTVKVYTQSELKEINPNAYKKALNKWREDGWIYGWNNEDLAVRLEETLEELEPTLKGVKLFFNIYGGQGSGVWFADFTLTEEQLKELVPSCPSEVARRFSFYVQYKNEYNTLDFDRLFETTDEQDVQAEIVRGQLAGTLCELGRKLMREGEKISDRLDSEERFEDESEERLFFVDGSEYTE
jgi:hypothetical protein